MNSNNVDELIKNNWPSKGTIKFENYSVKYRPNTEIVLKKLNFEIGSNEKVGVVGRTGSGKSTICLCLFRILEPLEGTIYIDNDGNQIPKNQFYNNIHNIIRWGNKQKLSQTKQTKNCRKLLFLAFNTIFCH